MPLVTVNGIRLNFEEYGTGDPVVLVSGSGASGRGWRPHQVPALTGAGFRVITVDNRGVPPSDVPRVITIDAMVADLAGLIESLRIGPCRLVGVSLGSIIVQELLVARPELVSEAVLMATRGHSDELSLAMARAELDLFGKGCVLPPRYEAVVRAMQSLSPSTLNDELKVRDWLDVFEISPMDTPSIRAHLGLDMIDNRLESYRAIDRPCLVIAFQDDLIVRPRLTRELADHIPGSVYEEIPRCGHFGYLEEPAAVNSAILDFFRRVRA
jgi:pimeloyl-ACP methyl ester carboxylesterase